MRLILTNTTKYNLNASVDLKAPDGAFLHSETFSLNPWQTRFLDVRELIARDDAVLGGISIHYDLMPGTILAQGYVLDPATGFSYDIPFTDPATVGDTKFEGAGTPVGVDSTSAPGRTFSGRLLLRNVSTVPVTVSPVLQRGASQSSLGQIVLDAGETRDVLVSPDSAPLGQGPVGIELAQTGQPGGLIAQWFSTDDIGSLIVETPLRSLPPNQSASGSNPFYLAGDFSSVTYIKNTGTTVSHFLAFIQTSAGQYTIGLKTAQPGETVAIDIGKLRDSQTPDLHGNLLPKDIVIGQINWRYHDGGAIVGRTLVLSQSGGISSNQSCQPCQCTPTSTSEMISPSTIDAGQTATAEVLETDIGCDGSTSFPIVLNNSSLTWFSFDENVATVSSNGIVTGVSAGHTLIDVSGGVPTFDWHFEGFDACGDAVGTCNPGNGDFFELQADVFVEPKITSISPAQGAVGDTIAVTIAGVGMTTGATVNAGSGITATVTSSSDTQVQANFVISASASGGNVNVTVTANGQTSNSMTFFVQVPSSLLLISAPALPTGTTKGSADGCWTTGTGAGDFGLKAAITYQVNDQNGGAISLQQTSIFEPQETVTNDCATYRSGCINPRPTPGDIGPTRITGTSKYTGTNGQFIDAPLGACFSATFTASATQTISILVSGSISKSVRVNSWHFAGTTSGHGSISNSNDITTSR